MVIYKIKPKYSSQLVTYNKKLCNTPSFYEISFLDSVIIDIDQISTVYELRGRVVSDFLSSSMYSNFYMIVSERFKTLLEQLNSNQFQFIPIKITKKDEYIGNYFVFHYIKSKEFLNQAIDWQNTNFEVINSENINSSKNKIVKFKNLDDLDQVNFQAIKDEGNDFLVRYSLKKIPDSEIFNFSYRLFPIGFFCTEKVKKMIENEGLTGIEFDEVDHFEFKY